MTETKLSKAEKEAGKIKDRAEKKAYLERKKKLVEIEKANFQKIIFMKATKGYWLVGGNSAVILANKLAPELKIRVGLKRDTDFDIKFSEGVINLRNLDFYREKLKTSNYLEEKVEKNESTIIFRLKEKVSETEFKLLLHSKEIRRQKLQNMIEKSVPMPKLNMRMGEVLKLTYKFYRKNSDSLLREFILDKLVEDVRVAHKTMVLVFRGQIEPKEGLRKTKTRLELSLADLTQVISIDAWSIEDSTVLATVIIETELLIEGEIKRIEKLEKKEAKEVKRVKAIIENNI